MPSKEKTASELAMASSQVTILEDAVYRGALRALEEHARLKTERKREEASRWYQQRLEMSMQKLKNLNESRSNLPWRF